MENQIFIPPEPTWSGTAAPDHRPLMEFTLHRVDVTEVKVYTFRDEVVVDSAVFTPNGNHVIYQSRRGRPELWPLLYAIIQHAL